MSLPGPVPPGDRQARNRGAVRAHVIRQARQPALLLVGQRNFKSVWFVHGPQNTDVIRISNALASVLLSHGQGGSADAKGADYAGQV